LLFRQPNPVSRGKRIAGLLLAVLLGLLTPVAIVLEMSFSMLMPVIALGGLSTVFLYSFAGSAAAGLCIAVQLGATAALLNTTFLWMTLLSGVLPAIWVARGIVAKRPFFDQLRGGIVAFVLGLLAALFIAYASYGGNMIGKFTDLLRAQFDLMPDDFFAPLVDAVNSAIAGSGLQGIAPITVEGYRTQLSGVLSMLEDAYSKTLPGALISGAMLTGILSVLWGNWLSARRGLATDVSYVSVARWFLPARISLGLLAVWLVSYVMSGTAYAAGETVYVAVYTIATAAFGFQGIAAVLRFFERRSNLTSGKRAAVVAVLVIFGLILRLLSLALFIIGVISALFGSHGAFRRTPDKSNSDHSGEDDPDR